MAEAEGDSGGGVGKGGPPEKGVHLALPMRSNNRTLSNWRPGGPLPSQFLSTERSQGETRSPPLTLRD